MIHIPKMKLVPKRATAETRKAMYDDYVKELRLLNPGHFDEKGQSLSIFKRFLNLFKG